MSDQSNAPTQAEINTFGNNAVTSQHTPPTTSPTPAMAGVQTSQLVTPSPMGGR